MNIKQAIESVRLDHIMKCLSIEPSQKKSKGRDLWFKSPFRVETDASFHIDSIKNIWYDFADGKGGNVIDFACHYLESLGRSHTVSDALNWLSQYATVSQRSIEWQTDTDDTNKILHLRRIQQLSNPVLLNYLKSRSIDPSIIKAHVKEAYIYNVKKKKEYFGLAFANDKGGYEFRNKYIKSTIGKKAITCIKGKRETSTVHLFEGFMDFLTLLTLKRIMQPLDDIIILNSLSFLPQAQDCLIENGYQNIFVWFDNDNAGLKARTKLIQWSENYPHLSLREMTEIYAPFNDVNEWYDHTLKVS